jgi:hypothetical protein
MVNQPEYGFWSMPFSKEVSHEKVMTGNEAFARGA